MKDDDENSKNMNFKTDAGGHSPPVSISCVKSQTHTTKVSIETWSLRRYAKIHVTS